MSITTNDRKEEFLHKSVSIKGESYKDESTSQPRMFHMSATRVRTTVGWREIYIEFGGQKISFSSKELGDNYEQAAFSFAKLIDEIAAERCALPEDSK